MSRRLRDSSSREIIAAYDVVRAHLVEVVNNFASPMFKDQILRKLEEPEAARMIAYIIDDALDAAEEATHEREKN